MRRLAWFFWGRFATRYAIDRAFGWSRRAALLRCWRRGSLPLVPPDAAADERRRDDARRQHAQSDRDRAVSDLLAALKRMRDTADE